MIFIEHKCRYGSRRIREALSTMGYAVSRRRVIKLMKSLQLCCKTKRKFKQTTDSNHQLPIAPNLVVVSTLFRFFSGSSSFMS